MHQAFFLPFLALSASAVVLPRQNISSFPSSTTGGQGCPPNMKSVTFNSGYDVNQFDKIGAADNWISFALTISGTPTDNAQNAHIPMMAFDSLVDDAVTLVNGPDAPEWMLTFNEPDWSYNNATPTMTAQEASDSIQRLLKSPGSKTKFIAPVTAQDPNWLPNFFNICECQSFFSAYNIHIYQPTLSDVTNILNDHHSQFGDKPTWITEIAPGNAIPSCSIDWDTAGDFMNGLYSFAADSGFIDRVFWNTGNQIDEGDTNVCNSYLLDSENNPSPLLDTYQNVGCN